ncbi:MAG: NAD(P)-dependent oxidoreductase [Bacteroides sp.]
MGKSILVTGASGFIGSFVVEQALCRGYEVWAGIRAASSKRYLKDDRIHFIEMDFAHTDSLSNVLQQQKEEFGAWDYVVHCAGITKCINKKEFEQGNYLYTKNFVDALIALNIVPKQFIYLSTLSVAGATQETTYQPIKDTDTFAPNTAYGQSKLKTEQYLASIPEFPYVFFRPTGVYGPREKDYFLMAKSVKHHIDFAPGYKRQDLTFIYVKDLVGAIFLAIKCEVTQRAYFLSDGSTYSSRSFAEYIARELGNPYVLHLQCPLFVLKVISLCAQFITSCFGKVSTLNADKYKIMRQRNWQCDITPITHELGFRPQYNLGKGVEETIAWYKQEKWL